jgi:hypothetical protein
VKLFISKFMMTTTTSGGDAGNQGCNNALKLLRQPFILLHNHITNTIFGMPPFSRTAFSFNSDMTQGPLTFVLGVRVNEDQMEGVEKWTRHSSFFTLLTIPIAYDMQLLFHVLCEPNE